MRSRAARGAFAVPAIALGLLVASAATLLPATTAYAAKPAPVAITDDACAGFEATTRQADPVLGGGVTVGTGREGNLFPAGSAPSLQVTTSTDSNPSEKLHVVVRDRTGVVATQDAALTAGTVALPNRPGWFKALAQRVAGQRVLGSTCVWYGVATAATKLDLSALPAGKDWGGPGAARDVALHAQLGVPVVRRQLDVAAFLANPVGDPALADAAATAARLGLSFVVQIGQGGAAETTAVANGSWGALVRRIVAANPTVRYWEAWNEPNTAQFFTGTAAAYVRDVLTPFAAAVRATSPGAKVVGGSALADDESWWAQFARGGGFRLVDVVGVHPYTWGWGAPESQGLWQVLRRVRTLADAGGGRRKPIFDTESAWPSAWQGTASTVWTQADSVARKVVIERALGVQSGEFEIEGGWQDWGVIDSVRGVKPAAMALATTTSQLAGRRFLGWWQTKVKGVWAARFSGGHGLTVVWSSASGSRTVSLHRRCTVAGSDAYGSAVRARKSLTVGSSPVFLTGATKKGAGCLTGRA